MSSKIGNSVVRHKIKRQVTSMLDSCVPLNSKIDIVVIVRKKYIDKSYNENKAVIEKVIFDILKKESKQ